jgi:hypothetical protein
VYAIWFYTDEAGDFYCDDYWESYSELELESELESAQGVDLLRHTFTHCNLFGHRWKVDRCLHLRGGKNMPKVHK